MAGTHPLAPPLERRADSPDRDPTQPTILYNPARNTKLRPLPARRYTAPLTGPNHPRSPRRNAPEMHVASHPPPSTRPSLAQAGQTRRSPAGQVTTEQSRHPHSTKRAHPATCFPRVP